MSVVTGKNGVLFYQSKIIACVRSVSISTDTSLIETTTAGSGKGNTYLANRNNTTGSLEGVMFINETGKWTISDLRKKQIAQILFEDVTLIFTDEDGNEHIETFDMYITQTSLNGTAGDFSNFNLTYQVNGDPVITNTCAELPEFEDVVLGLSSGVPPIGYTLEWNWSIPYTTGTAEFAYSLDDGDTWVPLTAGPNLVFSINESDGIADYLLPDTDNETAHLIRVRLVCVNYTDVYVEHIEEYTP